MIRGASCDREGNSGAAPPLAGHPDTSIRAALARFCFVWALTERIIWKCKILHCHASITLFRASMALPIKAMKNTWFVSFDTRISGVISPYRRRTKSFANEVDAKRFASGLIERGASVAAGTINPVQPKRLIASDKELAAWLTEPRQHRR